MPLLSALPFSGVLVMSEIGNTMLSNPFLYLLHGIVVGTVNGRYFNKRYSDRIICLSVGQKNYYFCGNVERESL